MYFHHYFKLKTRRHAILFPVLLNKIGIVADVHLVDQLAARKWDGIQQNPEATLNIMEIPDLVPLTVKTYNKAKGVFIFCMTHAALAGHRLNENGPSTYRKTMITH